jgi:DNA polymerase-3 subunit epsilon
MRNIYAQWHGEYAECLGKSNSIEWQVSWSARKDQMKTLSQRLRALRSWQGMTIAECAKKTNLTVEYSLSLKYAMAIEQEGERWKQDNLADKSGLLAKVASAYGVTPELMKRVMDDEWEWRMCAVSGNPKILPRMSQYIYRPLPEAAHNLFEHGFVTLDLETTGKDPHNGTQICEITVLDADGVPLLNSLVNPGIHIPDELTTNIHGISDEMVKDAPPFREIGPEIARIIDGQIVVIYNAGYDGWLLDRLFIENGLDMPDFQPWCLMLAYAEHYKAPGKFAGSYAYQKLSNACAQQGIEQDEAAHRSMADTYSTWRLLQKMAIQYSAEEEGNAIRF